MAHPSNRLSRLAALLILGAATGCSKPQPGATSQATPPISPLLAQQPHSDQFIEIEVAAGGFSTTYRAYFIGATLTHIAETRVNEAHDTAHGEYEFRGARLLRYAGDSLTDGVPLVLTFDLQGKLTSAGAADATAPLVGDVRNRAQLLRSHALAQRASRTHAAQGARLE